MQEILNPYFPDKIPESKRAFFGREDLAAWLEQQFIVGRRVIIFHGSKKIGKTTFLHFLPDLLTPQNITITFSFAREIDSSDFSIDDLLTYFVQTLTKQVIEAGVISPGQLMRMANPVSSANNILAQVQKRTPEAGVLFLFDDFDRVLELDPAEVANFLDVCRTLLNDHSRLRLVLMVDNTALPRLQHSILESAPTRPITTLNPNDALRLITEPLEGVIRFDYGVTKRIAELNSNHPYYLTLFSQALFNRYAREGWVNLRHLDETLETVLGMKIRAFEEIWAGATLVERAVLAALASLKGARGVFNEQEILPIFLRRIKEADGQVIITALESLTFQGVLVKMGASSYRFHIDLFRYWLQRHFDLETVLQDVIWKKPTIRPEPALPVKTENQAEPSATKKRVELKWPIWVLGLMGLNLVGIILVAFFFVSDFLGGEDTASLSLTPTSDVARFQTSTPIVLTPTPPLQSPTPTPPVVVSKPLPSIAYMARQDDAPWQIYIMNIDGSEVSSLSNLTADDTSPVWSARGELAFVSQRDNNREIYIMDIQGQNLVNFTNHPADDWTPAWSSDGTRIAFSSNRYGNWEIFVANADGSNLQQITNTGGGNISPVWSPDDQYLTFSSKRDGNWEIYTMRTDGTEVRRLTRNDASDLAPVWSFSGQFIAYETSVEGNVEIYVMTRTGENPRNISALPYADDHGPVWSPGDQNLVFYSNREGNWDLFAVNLDGSNTVNLTNTPHIEEQAPALRP